MIMFCPDCMLNLDDVPTGDPCPRCGGRRRGAQISGSAALAAASAMTGTIRIGYNQEPGWTYQWGIIQRHLARLREQYQGINTRDNIHAEETVHALFLALTHLADWLHQDQATGLTKATVDTHVHNHPASLGVCRAYANTFKHMKRDRPAQTVARIASSEGDRNGPKITIGHGPGNQPPASYARTDALDLA